MTTDDQKPKHKPSGKVTLEEVLKSLQDMIHTDLLEGEHVAQKPVAEKPKHPPAEEKPPKVRETPAIEDFASPSPASGPVNLGAVMRTLKDLVNNELNVGGEAGSSDNTSPAPLELHEPEEKASPEIEVNPADAENDLLDSLAFLSEDVSLPTPEIISEPASPIPEMEAIEFETAPEEIEAAPLPADTSDMIPPSIPEPEEIAFEIETPGLQAEPEQIEVAALPFDISDTPLAPAGEAPATSITKEAGQTEQPAPKSKRSGKNVPPGGLQHELLLDEAPAQLDTPAPESLSPTVADSDTTLAIEAATPLDDTNIEMVSMAPPTEPESPPEFLVPDAVMEIPEIENTPAPSMLGKAAMEMEIDAPAQESQNTPMIDFDAITLDEPSEESAPAIPAKTTLVTESAPAPLAVTAAIDEIKIETPAPQAMSMPSIDFNTVSLEQPKEKNQPAVPSSAPPALENDSPMLSVEFSPSPATPVQPAQETPPVAENKISVVEPAPKPATTSVESPKAPKPDDIPVLQDVVDAPAVKMAAKEPPAKTPPPAPDHARDAVIRAVAKLNIELRKAGGSGLDPKLITRLQQYMREELEKSAKKEG